MFRKIISIEVMFFFGCSKCCIVKRIRMTFFKIKLNPHVMKYIFLYFLKCLYLIRRLCTKKIFFTFFSIFFVAKKKIYLSRAVNEKLFIRLTLLFWYFSRKNWNFKITKTLYKYYLLQRKPIIFLPS